jgi:hypothetical protein
MRLAYFIVDLLSTSAASVMLMQTTASLNLHPFSMQLAARAGVTFHHSSSLMALSYHLFSVTHLGSATD